jgi:hypothetical protein
MVQNVYLYGDRLKFDLIVQLYSHKLFHPFFVSQINIVMKQLVYNKICLSFVHTWFSPLLSIFYCAIEKLDIHINTNLWNKP